MPHSDSAQNEDASINVSVTFRHTDSTEALKSYATEKIVNCLEKYIISATDVHVILSVEKRDHIAEARISSKRFDITAKATTEDLYSAIDKVVDNVTVQLRKQKERRVNHKGAAQPIIDVDAVSE